MLEPQDLNQAGVLVVLEVGQEVGQEVAGWVVPPVALPVLVVRYLLPVPPLWAGH